VLIKSEIDNFNDIFARTGATGSAVAVLRNGLIVKRWRTSGCGQRTPGLVYNFPSLPLARHYKSSLPPKSAMALHKQGSD
jgi:hypothetical protein